MNLALNEVQDENVTWEQFKVQKELEGGRYKTMKLVGDLILERQTTLLGHIIRLPIEDLMRMVSFNSDLKKPEQLYKRTGAPRLNWIDDNLQRAWNVINTERDIFEEFDILEYQIQSTVTS